MKLKSKLKLYEEFTKSLLNEAAGDTTPTDVAIDQTSTPTAGETIRTEVIRDVDTILNNLIELSDRITESDSITLEMDELFEELFDLTNISDLNEGILDFIKSPIKFMKIKKNLKGYQKALIQQAVNDVDFAKKKQASKEDPDKKGLATLDAANKAKNQALKDQLDAITERMAELSKGDEGLAKVVSIGKTKSKLAAAKVVMKATSGEEAKQLKLEIDTLENRIADDEQSLKDYAAKQEPATDDTDTDSTSDNQMDGVEANDDKEKEKEDKAKKDAAIADQQAIVDAAKAKLDELPQTASDADKAKAKIAYMETKLKLATLKEDDQEVIDGFKQEILDQKEIIANQDEDEDEDETVEKTSQQLADEFIEGNEGFAVVTDKDATIGVTNAETGEEEQKPKYEGGQEFKGKKEDGSEDDPIYVAKEIDYSQNNGQTGQTKSAEDVATEALGDAKSEYTKITAEQESEQIEVPPAEEGGEPTTKNKWTDIKKYKGKDAEGADTEEEVIYAKENSSESAATVNGTSIYEGMSIAEKFTRLMNK